MSKVALRQKFLEQRRSIAKADVDQKSACIRKVMVEYLASQKHDQILLFTQHGNEPDLLSFVTSKSNFVSGIPVVSEEQGHMAFYKWKPADRLIKNRYGILEPDPTTAQKISMTETTLCLVPALAVTREGGRLGFGGGYYDRFLHSHPLVTTLGVVFDDFIVDELPIEAHDRMLDAIVSESGVMQVKG